MYIAIHAHDLTRADVLMKASNANHRNLFLIFFKFCFTSKLHGNPRCYQYWVINIRLYLDDEIKTSKLLVTPSKSKVDCLIRPLIAPTPRGGGGESKANHNLVCLTHSFM